MKLNMLSAFVIGCSLPFLLSHGAIGKDKDEDTDESESEVTIEKTVLAKETKDGFDRDKPGVDFSRELLHDFSETPARVYPCDARQLLQA